MNTEESYKNLSESNPSTKHFFLTGEVVEGGSASVEEAFRVLCRERGITFADFYNAIGIDKSYASKIRRGLIIPPLFMRVRIAQFFKIDSSVIWSWEVQNG